MTEERVRIGLAVRETEVRFSVQGSFSAEDRTTNPPVFSPGATWKAIVAEPSESPRWTARLHTFLNRDDADNLASLLTKHGVQAEVARMGEDAHWGAAGVFSATAWAVLSGDSPNREDVIRATREALAGLPLLPDTPPGWKRYDDQIMTFDIVRHAPPSGGRLRLTSSEGITVEVASPVRITPQSDDALFELEDVRIGIDLHWDHREHLTFRGALELVADGGAVTAINDLELDHYLASVLGSEMRPDWPTEALSAQAVAARSTVLATRGRHHLNEAFDLCHDDHCQDYQGISREGETALQALKRCKDCLLVLGGRVVDARFAKSCGGVTDNYSTAWDDDSVPSLEPVLCTHDSPESVATIVKDQPDGSGWKILHLFVAEPPAWAACNPEYRHYPASVTSMEKLYRWQRMLSRDELIELVHKRTGVETGEILDLVPLEYGVSGRIKFLRVVGESASVTVGKELAIRRLLSDSHLPSSAFEIHRGSAGEWIFDGIGWGHGVGLCQMGAAALAAEGWPAKKIVSHYYPGAGIEKR